MKKYIFNSILALTLAGGMTSCGEDYLDTDIYNGIDIDSGLNSVSNIQTALNGTYYQFCRAYFAGNYATNIGDIVSDISYWNGKTGHFDGLYQFTYSDTDTYLYYIWDYGYKVVDNAARIIQAAQALYANATESEKAELDQALAEAYALRGYANLAMVNVYGHQVKVDGKDFSSEKGLVLVDEPIGAFTQVERSTVGATYDFIKQDLSNAISEFNKAGGDRGSLVYFNKAAVYGLLARTSLYLEEWSNATSYAQQALDAAGNPSLAYTEAGYKALYNNSTSNSESFFALAINSTTNWSANSCGTLWSTYNFSPSPYLNSLYAEGDVRKAIMDYDASATTETVPVYNGGKFQHFESGNSAYATCYLVNAPEMYLIQAEANVKQNNVSAAQSALLNVAKRNPAIASTADLPSTADALLEFVKEERARELFQEGFRLWDLRRWGQPVSVSAYNAPNIDYSYKNYQVSNLVFPIPNDEITTGYGVEQNDWASTMPK
jgi:hypothetical protein